MKPLGSAVSSYTPGGTAAIRERPSASVTVERTKPVSILRAVTVTPGTAAACASTAAPMTVAVSCCACREAGTASTAITRQARGIQHHRGMREPFGNDVDANTRQKD